MDKQINDIISLTALVDTLRTTSSKIEKEAILCDSLKNNRNLANWLRLVYDPYIHFHLTSKRALSQAHVNGRPERDIKKLLEKLRNRQLTGELAAAAWYTAVKRIGEPFQSTANAILDKDLKCRLGVKTVNKVFKRLKFNLIPDFCVALGEPYKNQQVWNETEHWFASRKLDGVRCLIILEDGRDPQLLSRSGIPFESLKELEQHIIDAWFSDDCNLPNCVLDGELALDGDGTDDFHGIVSQIRRKDHDITNAVFHAFDCVSLNAFRKGESKAWFDARQRHLKEVLEWVDTPHIRRVPQWRVSSEKRFTELVSASNVGGWEGLILRKNAPYLGKRSSDVLKVKEFKDAEFKVIGIETGTMQIVKNGKEKVVKVMTAAVIKYKKRKVRVGSGWTVTQRRQYRKKPDKLIGKTITVQYARETVNNDGGPSLLFPIVKAIHGKKRKT